MLIQDFIQVPKAYGSVRDLILGDPHEVIDPNARAAYMEGELLCIRLEPLLRRRRLGHKVIVDIGEPYFRGSGVVLPVHWWADGAAYLFPRLDADLEIMPLGEDVTQLTFSGRYDPPSRMAGQKLDRQSIHSLAEGTVRSFLNRIGTRLQSGDLSPV